MRYHALACDYDGTIARDGAVSEETIAAMHRLVQSGRRLILVTGRELPDLLQVFPRIDLFDRAVVENGALLYRPATRESVVLAEAPPPKFVDYLRRHNVKPLSCGRVIVATWEPNEIVVLEAIRALGLELQVIFNKGAVMVLPSGVNKATGLKAALEELGLSAHNCAGVGDGENDHAFLSLCECAVATSNAVDLLKERADMVTSKPRGEGVAELIDLMIAGDLKELEPRLERHRLPFGIARDGQELKLAAYGESVMIAGASGSGKSTLATTILEQAALKGYQFCVVDPEGDYDQLEGVTAVGTPKQAPDPAQVMQVLEHLGQNAAVNMLGLPLHDRPKFFEKLLPLLQQMRTRTGRPHWLLIDEAHHLLPRGREAGPLEGVILITVHPDQVSEAVLSACNTFIVVGSHAAEILQSVGGPPAAPLEMEPSDAVLWQRARRDEVVFRPVPSRSDRLRHRRKYAEGELGEDRSFYFRGPEGKLNLRARNLMMFTDLAQGVDDETWNYHLDRGDYSRWFLEAIKDPELAEEAAAVEARKGIPTAESRAMIESAITKRYTAPA